MTLPVNTLGDYFPLNGLHSDAMRKISQFRAEDQAIWISGLTGKPAKALSTEMEKGNNVIVPPARQQVEAESGGGSITVSVLDDSFDENLDPEEAAERVRNEQEKTQEWFRTSDLFYMEQALSLNDPAISSEISRMATNLQIGQEVFEEALKDVKGGDRASIGRYIWDFVDRYLFRAVPIGGVEQITNRNERKGRELQEALVTLSPKEYETFIRGYIDELKAEGFFTDENIFALVDGLAEFENAGVDRFEWLNRTFGAFDVAPVAGLAVAGARKLAKATGPLERVAALKGPEASADVGEAILKSNPAGAPVRVVDDMNPDAIRATPSPDVKVPANRVQRITSENKIVRGIKHLVDKNTFGRGLGSAEVDRAVDMALEVIRKGFANPLVNVSNPVRRDPTGGFLMEMTFGTVKTGKPYATKRGAEKAAAKARQNDLPTARAVQADPSDETKGFYVQAEQRLDIDAQVDEIQPHTFNNAIVEGLARFAGSKALTEDPYLNTLAVAAEAGTSSVGRLIKKELKAANRLNTAQKRTMSEIFRQLRDGEDAFLREGYTPGEFADKWQTLTGTRPTQQIQEAFEALQSINDASWAMRAHNRLQKYVQKGYWTLELPDNVRVPAKKFEGNVPSNETIYDVSTGSFFLQRDLRKTTAIWQLDRELEGGIRYVVNPSKVDILQHSDVLGYNAGGRRINPNANHFVVSMGKQNSPRAFLATFSTKEAKQAVDQIKAVQDAIRTQGGLEAVAKRSLLDDLVQANNDWNLELQTFDDWIQFFKDKKIDPMDDIEFKARDGEIADGEVRDPFSTNWGEYVTFGMHRADDLLTEFGGKPAFQHNPVEAMFQDFTSITHQFANNDYTNAAMHSWVKAARRQGSGWELDDTADIRRAYESAKPAQGGSTLRGDELARQRGIINRRLNIKSEPFRRMEEFGARFSEFVYEKSKGVKPIRLTRDPGGLVTNGLLSLAYQSAFGLGNISQFFVQGYHASTVVAISPKHGFRGAAMSPGMMMLLMADDPVQASIGVRRLANYMGLPEEDFKELVEYIHTSGRDIIDAAVIENGTGAAWGLPGWKGEDFLPSRVRDVVTIGQGAAQTALKAGLIPFRQGERMARLTSINTAFLEFKAKYPNTSAMSTFGRKWINEREQALSFRMTNANRAFMQEGFGKLPTQWFSYTLRSMESIAIGRGFTAGERARMAMVLGPMFGLTGMGIQWAADEIGEFIGVEPAGEAMTALKYGFWDYFIEATTGVEGAVAERLAPITLIQDVYRNVTGAEPAYRVIGGPSIDIAGGMLEQLWNVVTEASYGDSIALTDDVIRTARQFTGVDNFYRGIGILNNGIYRSRNGKTLPFELNTSDAIMQFMGFTPREVNEWYLEKRFQYQDSKKVRDYAKEIEQDWRLAVSAWRDGKEQEALELMKIIDIKIKTSGFSYYDQKTLQRSLRRMVDREMYEMIRYHMLRENPYTAERLEETFDRPGENN